jgi:nitrogen fixation protein NifZ
MSETRIPKFDWGQRVTASIDLFNDGSHPESELDALLVGQGTAGEVVQVGMHEESSTPVYMVEFDSKRVVGCLEEEIALVQAREA